MEEIFQILAVVFGLLFYLFGSSGKKKAEEAKKKAKAQKSTADTKPKQGLQERLEEALRQMQDRVESQKGEVQTSASRPEPTMDTGQVASESSRSSGAEGEQF